MKIKIKILNEKVKIIYITILFIISNKYITQLNYVN